MSQPRSSTEVDAADRGLLELIGATFEPVMAALDSVDLADLPLEPDLDPGRAPRPVQTGQ
jgi:hypothetical protein